MTETDNISPIEGPASNTPAPAHNAPRRTAQTVSWLLHPLVQPVYVLLTIIFSDAYMIHLTGSVKLYLIWVILLYSTVIPMLSIGFLRSIGILSDLSISTRRSRIIPLLIGSICYVLCAITLSKLVTVTAIHKFIIAAACCEIFALIVTPFWKISLHMIGMGCITAMFYLLNIAGMGQMFWALVVSIICSGALASARLQLQSHNLAQIAAGFFGGFIIAMIAILFI